MRVDVLDHGYVTLVESWGSDEHIIAAARQSTDGAFRGWGPKEDGSPGDEKLLRHLWTSHHDSVFEFAGLVIEVQAPIFVFREWHRHRTQSFSELSARYTQMPNLHYVPSIERIMAGRQSRKNKQGSEEGVDQVSAERIQKRFRQEQALLYENYEDLCKFGLARELARVNTPVSRYSRMRASANLRNWLGFLRLRTATDAQWEIRQYAEAVNTMIAQRFPRVHALTQDIAA